MRPDNKLRALLHGSAIAVAALLMSAGPAAAQRCEAPPGTAGLDQYCETVPGAKGDRHVGVGPRVGGSLDRNDSRALEEAGRDGRAVLALPGRGAPSRGEKAEQPESKEPSGSAIGAVGSGIESGFAAGPGFIWLLVAIGVGMVGIAWMRYRRGSTT